MSRSKSNAPSETSSCTPSELSRIRTRCASANARASGMRGLNLPSNASTASASQRTAVIATRSTSAVNRGSPQRATASPPMTHAPMPCSRHAVSAEAAATNSCLTSRPAAPVPHETRSVPTPGCSDREATMPGHHQGAPAATSEIESLGPTHSHGAMPSTWPSTAVPTPSRLRDCLKIRNDSC